ncbi:hypothetical protein SKAU_G00333410 [Synaphobranchus kaupii]|uniref:Uncharacterized protein n=1 Tax=Synaphobranchus kaupii TaxID=118154 RepID=A0A9Q1ELR9_SYNKA|nr:hypothetical protein SKAU_G00333410 [Synaphobranchus kaupii]
MICAAGQAGERQPLAISAVASWRRVSQREERARQRESLAFRAYGGKRLRKKELRAGARCGDWREKETRLSDCPSSATRIIWEHPGAGHL